MEDILKFVGSTTSNLIDAKEHQEKLTAIYTGEDMSLFKKKWGALITEEKKKVFNQLYKNYAGSIINKVEVHLNKIFNASGGGERIEFEDVDNGLEYKEYIQPELMYKESPLQFFSDNYIRLLISEPSSIFLTYTKVNEESEQIFTELIDLESVLNIETYYKSIVKFAFKRSEDTIWYVDDTSVYEVKGDVVTELFQHGGLKDGMPYTPACFVSNEIVTHKNMVMRKSPITDSLLDLEDYNVFSTFGLNYKAFSAFGKEVKPEVRDSNGKKDRKHNINVDNKSGKPPMPPMTESRKNDSLFGEVITIPFMLQTEDKLTNIKNMYFRIEGDTKLLEFQKSDIKDLEVKILNDTLGGGFGFQEVSGNKTATEIMASFDTQEANLLSVKGNAETTLTCINSLACEMFADDFVEYRIDLGTQFFLKNEKTLLDELKLLKEVTNNEYVIKEKISEIHKTHNPLARGKEDRFNLVYLLQPYANRSEDWVTKNRKVISDEYSLFLYDNFHTILGLFESQIGKIEIFGKDLMNREEHLFNTFNTFALDYYERRKEGYSIQGDSEGGEENDDNDTSQGNS